MELLIWIGIFLVGYLGVGAFVLFSAITFGWGFGWAPDWLCDVVWVTFLPAVYFWILFFKIFGIRL